MTKEGLCDEANLEIFTLWYAWGGMQRGLSPTEIAEMPMTMIKDFNYLLQRMRKLRKKQEFFRSGK